MDSFLVMFDIITDNRNHDRPRVERMSHNQKIEFIELFCLVLVCCVFFPICVCSKLILNLIFRPI